ncbi:MAG: ATP-binding cassette domain-containing protein [Armatimonadetes bacterium]|nr:ATP-binding cassette domain-containing protein [Armatimonadota bacterium]NIM23818.1 ATP-binding cassette domain-containing protein [Armatimonadota bacterium]NIM67697.1 ATP-binding cassette domain-containing protein [Armatimonadota bacterium]NIM76207.1 ATP-binding cassette domain-containing protein [Armatimonadota bacterium]NIN05899.1 ATP-binding cassette domain-containing protein [Armatimonadota bacterium]
MLSLQAQAITHLYQGRAVLQDVNLEIPVGERFALVGPNGAGKSTLLRVLSLLEEPSRGQVFVRRDGKSLHDGITLRRRMVMVPQHPFLFNTSVLGNVLYGLKVRRTPSSTARMKAYGALEKTGLTGLARQPAPLLSGGEAQLLSLARAIALEPEVLFLDEITAHLDPHNESRVEKIVLKYGAERNATIVLVTQNLSQACRLARRGAVLYEGQLAESGLLPDFLHKPQEERTARFVQGRRW